MTHPLDGARLKVVRAQEHLDALKAELAMYVREHPYDIGANFNDYSSIYPTITKHPPLRFSTIVGDCVTNARAALDYVMWELLTLFADPAINLSAHQDRVLTSFPISEGPSSRRHKGHCDNLKSLAKRKIPTAAINGIKIVQPYNTGNLALCWLHQLVNTDKHRVPLFTIAKVNTFALSEDVWHRTVSLSAHGDRWVFARPGYRPAFTTVGGEEMQVNYQATVYIAFADVSMPREPVDRTLEQIIETVADVIPRFDRFF
jgi:hypothetical protein